MSDNKSPLAAALVKAQADLKNPGFDSQNPHFRSKFASLASVRAAVVPALAKHGLVVIQPLVSTAEGIGVSTTILHESGERMDFPAFVLPAAKHDPQGYGSAATYARRYALMAVAGVVGDEDDDANAATDARRQEQAEESLWTNPTQRKHYSVEIQRLWGRGDAMGLKQLVDELNNEQKLDIWRDFNPTQRNEIKALLTQANKEAA